MQGGSSLTPRYAPEGGPAGDTGDLSPASTPSSSAPTSSSIANSSSLMAQLVHVAVLSSLSYGTMSVLTTLTNKMLLSSAGFGPYSLFLLYWQHIATVALVLGARTMGWIQFDLPSWNLVVKWIPLNAIFVFMLLSNAQALRYISVPMVTVLKNLSTVLTATGDYFIFGQQLTRGLIASMVIMVFSSIVATFSDLEFHLGGYIWAGLNILASSAYVLYMKLVLKNFVKNEFMGVLLNNSIALPLLLPLLFAFNQFWPAIDFLENSGFGFRTLLLLNGVIGFGLSSSSFWCVKATSPTTYSMVGSLNKIALVGLGWIIFSSPITWSSFFSVTVGVGGGIMYAYFKNQQAQELAKAKSPV